MCKWQYAVVLALQQIYWKLGAKKNIEIEGLIENKRIELLI